MRSAIIVALLPLASVIASGQDTLSGRTATGRIGEPPTPARLNLIAELETPNGQNVLFENQGGSLKLAISNSGGTPSTGVIVRINRKQSSGGLVMDTVRSIDRINPADTVRLSIRISTTVVLAREVIPLFVEVSDSAGFGITYPLVVELERRAPTPGPDPDADLPPIFSGRNWLFVIGVNRYELLPELQTPVYDATAVRDLLFHRYGFDQRHLIELLDEHATRANIIKGFESLAALVRPEDNVLVYYSGHGLYDKTMRRGYWIPVNAEENSTAEYLSNTELHALIAAVNSRATLVISDACFSGTIFKGAERDARDLYLDRVARPKARQALISGGDEPVLDASVNSDHSVFAHHLIRQLEANQDKYLTASELFDLIKLQVIINSHQTPQCRPIPDTGDEGGQFIFVRHR